MDGPRPYITAAFLCESILQEKDGVLTAVRILDKMTLYLPPEGMPGGAKPAVKVTGLVGFKSGPVTGNFTLKIGVTKPSGDKKSDVIVVPVALMGGDQGQNIILNIGLGVEADGLYWFDVTLEEELLTRIPLMIITEQVQPSQG